MVKSIMNSTKGVMLPVKATVKVMTLFAFCLFLLGSLVGTLHPHNAQAGVVVMGGGGYSFPATRILEDFAPDDAHPMTGWTDFYNGVDASGGYGLNAYAGDLSVSGWNTAYTADTIEGYVTIVTKTTTDNKPVGILFSNSVTGDRYDLYIQYDAGVEKAQVLKYLNSTYDSSVADITTTIGNGDSFGMSVRGTSIKVYRKPSGGSWGQIGAYTVTALGVNKLALQINDTTLRIADFGGGTIP
jgi:hypothetical protein